MCLVREVKVQLNGQDGRAGPFGPHRRAGSQVTFNRFGRRH